MASILIKNGSVVTVDDQQQVYPKGYIFIEDDLITAVSPGDPPAELEKRYSRQQCLPLDKNPLSH